MHIQAEVMTADCRKMEEATDELERKNEKLTAQLARQTARAEKVAEGGENRRWRRGCDAMCLVCSRAHPMAHISFLANRIRDFMIIEIIEKSHFINYKCAMFLTAGYS